MGKSTGSTGRMLSRRAASSGGPEVAKRQSMLGRPGAVGVQLHGAAVASKRVADNGVQLSSCSLPVAVALGRGARGGSNCLWKLELL